MAKVEFKDVYAETITECVNFNASFYFKIYDYLNVDLRKTLVFHMLDDKKVELSRAILTTESWGGDSDWFTLYEVKRKIVKTKGRRKSGKTKGRIEHDSLFNWYDKVCAYNSVETTHLAALENIYVNDTPLWKIIPFIHMEEKKENTPLDYDKLMSKLRSEAEELVSSFNEIIYKVGLICVGILLIVILLNAILPS